MKPADPLELPLAGLTLVEASAGTGKTTLLVRLYLRALLVEGLTIDRILAVTYTRAATGELSVRIRRELVDTVRQLHHPDERDEFSSELFANAGDEETLYKRINAALAAFDDKAVFTIHGFCQRMLADNAFEAGVAFASEQTEDEDALRTEIAADFWRRRVGPCTPTYVKWFVETFHSPDRLLHKTLKNALQVSGPLAVEPGVNETKIRNAEGTFADAAAAACREWQAARARLTTLLRTHEGLNGNTYNAGAVAGLLAQWEQWLTVAPAVKLPDKFDLLTASIIQSRTNKGQKPPDEPFFEAAEALQEAAKELNKAWWQEAVAAALTFVREEARRRKRKTRELGFDDMLANLRDALEAPGGKKLARRIARQYPLILVDEFQDTDPLQHEIFTTIHAALDAHGLILIGDPKQAIYRFRGSDIFTYLKARDACEKTDRLYNLTHNYRSAVPLLTAVNSLFGDVNNPFEYARISYTRVESGRKPPISALAMPKDDDAPLTIVWEDAFEGESFKKNDADNRAAALCATEIKRLLALGRENKTYIDEKPLQAKDIAVLVNDNKQGLLIQEGLRRRGIATAMVATQSVFVSPQADELESVLAAVAEPANGHLLRRALATQLLGATAAELANWTQDEARWGEVVGRFREYYALWQERGFSTMFARLVNAEGVIQRTLARGDGERVLTNLRHLAELAGAEAARRPGIAPLLAWFGAAREEDTNEESRQLRLESDENLVRIATIHKAKGLQYPVTFLPFLWDGKIPRGRSNTAVLTHDADYRVVLDLGSEDASVREKEAERERHAENVRRNYVALTRAERACYLIAMPVRRCEESALARLLDVSGPSEFHDGLKRWVKRASKTIKLRAPTAGASVDETTAARPHGEAREFPYPDRLRQRFHIASYSLLVADAHGGAAERPDWDETVTAPPATETAQGIHAFPAGAASGMFLHALIEELPFNADAGRIAAAVKKQLVAHGFDADKWTPPLSSWLAGVFATPLGEPGCDLASIPDTQRVNEMEFHFLLQQIEAATLDRSVAGFAPQVSRPGLNFRPLAGQMKGYIDLVFEHEGRYWIVDYKSNRLGSSLDDYTPAALDHAMAEHRYDLQYLVYTLALHRYLQTRLPGYDYEKHFGGVLYLFLRGMAPEAPVPRGVWHTRPAKPAIERLNGYLAGARNE